MLSELKSHLKGLAPKFPVRQPPLYSTSYLISSAGSLWNKLTEEHVHVHSQLEVAEIEAIEGNLFEQVK